MNKKNLNIACGNVPLPGGWINIDKYYYPGSTRPGMNLEDGKTWNSEHPDSPWLYGDAVHLEFPDGVFDSVIMVHALEHLSMEDGNRCLGEISRVLKQGGTVEIEVPDLTRACQLFSIVHISEEKDNADWFRIMGLLYGTTGQDGEGQFHLCGYSKEYLAYRLREHHFVKIEEIPVGFGHGTRIGQGRPEPMFDFRIRGYKS